MPRLNSIALFATLSSASLSAAFQTGRYRRKHVFHPVASTSPTNAKVANEVEEDVTVPRKSTISPIPAAPPKPHANHYNPSLRMRVFATLNDPKSELLAAGSVVFSTFLVALSTLDNLSIETYAGIEDAVTGLNVLFTVDFFLRWYAAGQFKLIYLTKPLAIIDVFVVIIPLFVGSFMPILDGIGFMGDLQQTFASNVADSSGLQVLLLLRVLRLKRVLTDIQTFRRFAGAIGIRRSDVRPYQLQLARVLLSIFTLLSVASGLIYTAEHTVNPDIPDYFTALYFGLTTLTTVGFGDITPVTFNGRLVVCGSILAGVAVIPPQAAKLVDAIIASQENDVKSTVVSSVELRGSRTIGSSATNGLGPSGTDLEVPLKEAGSMGSTANASDSYKVCGKCRATGHRVDASYCWSCGSRI